MHDNILGNEVNQSITLFFDLSARKRVAIDSILSPSVVPSLPDQNRKKPV